MDRLSLTILLFAATMLTAGCGLGDSPAEKQQQAEAQGQVWLTRGRHALVNKDFAAARTCIDSLRQRCAMALNAREEGILLLDSIEISEAQQQLAEARRQSARPNQSLQERDESETDLDRAAAKLKYFKKKLQVDISRREQH